MCVKRRRMPRARQYRKYRGYNNTRPKITSNKERKDKNTETKIITGNMISTEQNLHYKIGITINCMGISCKKMTKYHMRRSGHHQEKQS